MAPVAGSNRISQNSFRNRFSSANGGGPFGRRHPNQPFGSTGGGETSRSIQQNPIEGISRGEAGLGTSVPSCDAGSIGACCEKLSGLTIRVPRFEESGTPVSERVKSARAFRVRRASSQSNSGSAASVVFDAMGEGLAWAIRFATGH